MQSSGNRQSCLYHPNKAVHFQMLIRISSEDFFLKLVFHLAAKIFLDLFNIRARQLQCEFSPHSLFQHITLRKFSHNKLKLCVRDMIVSQCFGNNLVNRVMFRNDKRGNLLIILNLRIKLFAGDYKPWRSESETPANTAKWNCSRQANNRQSRAKACARECCRKSTRANSAPVNTLFSPFIFFGNRSIAYDLVVKSGCNIIDFLQPNVGLGRQLGG